MCKKPEIKRSEDVLYDINVVSNLVIQYCLKNDIFLNNLKLNQLLCVIQNEWIRKRSGILLDEKPISNARFTFFPSVYDRFRHYGAKSIRNIPSDFDFLSLLEDNFNLKDLPEGPHSEELLSNMNYLDNEIGIWIYDTIHSYVEKTPFELVDEVNSHLLSLSTTDL